MLQVSALQRIKSDGELRARLANWMTETHALGIDIPAITLELTGTHGRMAGLAAAIAEWDQLRNYIAPADQQRLWDKLRLEWNYNSNHIEGNTLTYGETAMLLIHGRAGGERPIRHYEEMKAHAVAIDHVRSLAEEERVLSEGDVRDFNKILLKEPFWHDAETSEGQPTRKWIVPGKYKTQPNHVRTPTGALHRFAEPEDTPDRMKQWVSKFQRDLERYDYPLPLFLAESHHEFLQIHPFGDGNGRTARLLANYVLLRRHLPPMVIKSADRDRYLAALQKADLGEIMPLEVFMLENTLWSLDLAIRAAKGESIDEPGDLVKKIDMFVRHRSAGKSNKRDLEKLDDVVSNWIRPMKNQLKTELAKVGDLFRGFRMAAFAVVEGKRGVYWDQAFDSEIWTETKKNFIAGPGFRLSDESTVELGYKLTYKRYKGGGRKGFSVELCVSWEFHTDSVSFSALVENDSVDSATVHLSYGELHKVDADIRRSMDAIGMALMDAIDRQSE